MNCNHKKYVRWFYNKTYKGDYQFIFKCVNCKKVLEFLDEDGNELQKSNPN